MILPERTPKTGPWESGYGKYDVISDDARWLTYLLRLMDQMMPLSDQEQRVVMDIIPTP